MIFRKAILAITVLAAGLIAIPLATPADAGDLLVTETRSVEMVNTTNFTAAQLAQFIESDEADIFRLYGAALGRTPDYNGLAYWTILYRDFKSISHREIAELFVNSPEFNLLYGPDRNTIVYNLYENILGREPDLEGLHYWINSPLSIVDLVVNFAESPENKAHLPELFPLVVPGDQMTFKLPAPRLPPTITAFDYLNVLTRLEDPMWNVPPGAEVYTANRCQYDATIVSGYAASAGSIDNHTDSYGRFFACVTRSIFQVGLTSNDRFLMAHEIAHLFQFSLGLTASETAADCVAMRLLGLNRSLSNYGTVASQCVEWQTQVDQITGAMA